MPFATELIPARFERRLNRFTVDVYLDGRRVRAHLHDPGRLVEILAPGTEVFLTPVAGGTRRQTAYTVTLARTDGVLAAIDSSLANHFVEGCLRAGAFHEFRDFALVRREVRSGANRFDFHLMGSGVDILLEVKSVTLVRDGLALFPDAPTARGARHLHELMAAADRGICGTLLFLVQRPDAGSVSPNDAIDRHFAAALRDAYRCGIEILAYTTVPTTQAITLSRRIPVRLDRREEVHACP